MMDNEQLKILISEAVKLPAETEWVEFKVDYANPEDIGKLISGLSNSANLHQKPYGYLIFGVDDNLRLVGTQLKPRTAKKGSELLEHWLMQGLSPKIDFRIYETELEGKQLVLFEIPAAIDSPVRFINEEYIRIGSITRKLREFPDKERKIWNNPQHRSFEKEAALANVGSDTILELLNYPEYFHLTKQPLPSDKNEILLKLEQDKIIQKSKGLFTISNMGALLFAKDIRKFESIKRKAVRVVIYKGKNRIETIKEQEGAKGYASGFQGLIEYINDKLPSNEEIQKAFRVEKKMFPQIAVRELIANALIHQDLTEKGTGPMIEIFEDRIEISNPGTPLINVDRFIDHSPKSRNEAIASFMRRINICEERGSGIDKVIFQVEVYQLPAPKFEQDERNTKAILYAYKPLSKMGKEDKIRACYQHCCLKYVSNEKMTNTSLRKRFDIKDENYSIASRIISDTVKAGFIKAYDAEKSRSRRLAKYVPVWA